jgi:hypothetical protein
MIRDASPGSGKGQGGVGSWWTGGGRGGMYAPFDIGACRAVGQVFHGTYKGHEVAVKMIHGSLLKADDK